MRKRAIFCVREPSLGPYFGIKGGGTGAGRAQVVPAEAINLHFVGDMYAVTKANNLLAAMVDNHLQHGNELGIDPRQIVLRRVIDLNDRALRDIIIGLGGVKHGVPRRDGFNITPASEVMAILCLARDYVDLGERLSQMVVAFNYRHEPVRASQIEAVGAMQGCCGTRFIRTWPNHSKALRPLYMAGRSPTSRREPTPPSPRAWRLSWRIMW